MATDDEPIVNEDPSRATALPSSNSLAKMQGWLKLIEDIRKSDPPAASLARPSPNTRSRSIRAERLATWSRIVVRRSNQRPKAPEAGITTITIGSPPNAPCSPPVLSIASTPAHSNEDVLLVDNDLVTEPRARQESVPSVELESTGASSFSSSSPTSTDSKQSSMPSKAITAHKTVKNKGSSSTRKSEISTPITEDISDDDMPLVDLRKQKIESTNTLSIPSAGDFSIPLATDLQSLPGHIQNEQRDCRFLIYNDIDTLSTHLQTCLYLDRHSIPSASPSSQDPCRTHCNVLNKIFRIYHIKTLGRSLSLEKKAWFLNRNNHKQQRLSLISSPTSASFRMDWSINRRNPTSTQRQGPRNVFHLLQLQPKKDFALMHHVSTLTKAVSKTPVEKFESIKDILARTYYPHLHTAIECGCHFGAASRFPSTERLVSTHVDLVPIKEMPRSPDEYQEDAATTTPVSFSAPLSLNDSQPRESTDARNEESPRPSSTSAVNNHIQGLAPWMIKQSVVLLTPTKIPLASTLPPKDKTNGIVRKRKPSAATNSTVIERKKRRVTSSSSTTTLETVHPIEDAIGSESDGGELPAELPKQSFIKNGLRSNYYKKGSDDRSMPLRSKTRPERRRQSSGSLPPFYTGIYQSDDDKASFVDYCLPYDIYWYGQKTAKEVPAAAPPPPTPPKPLPPATTTDDSSQKATAATKKKKGSQPKQKQPLPYKRISRNVYTDQLRQSLLSSYSPEKAPVCDCKPPGACEDGVCVNRMIFTECLPSCACGSKCTNQKIRKGQWSKHLEVFDTGKYGQGLRTTAPIPKGTFLCEYVGEIITDEKFHERMTNLYAKDEHHYTMKLTQSLVIDAYRMGSSARFANHSCAPNCAFEKWTVDGLERMCMFSSRPIETGEELTYDYNFKSFNSEAQQPCYCDKPDCRGKIGEKQSATTVSNNNHDQQHPPTTVQKLSQRERRLVRRSSIFLLRNLRRIKAKKDLEKKSYKKITTAVVSPGSKQTDRLSSMTLFFPQNYYHSNRSNQRLTMTNLRKTSKTTHKDMFCLFYNHIRRSHFVKTFRHHRELIDETCYYAQLAQLSLVLNELFECIVSYKYPVSKIAPAEALKRCPSKRLFPAYYDIIAKPIDLSMIRTKLDNGDYSSFQSFEDDISLLLQNAITYCGVNSDETQPLQELQKYFLRMIKSQYKKTIDLFIYMQEDERSSTSLRTLEDFIARFHENEVRDGQVREALYDAIFDIADDNDDDDDEEESPIIYKIVLEARGHTNRLNKRNAVDGIIHCRCGSVHDEVSLVQCYACQLWQHVACVSITDSSRPYFCFECHPACEQDPSACLKSNVMITAALAPVQTYDDNHTSYSTLTRADGFVIRVNECYFVPKQDRKNIDRELVSPEYDILCVERLWLDDHGVGQASGYYFIRPNETFHEAKRRFYRNEVFRFPSSNDPLPIRSFVRPCFVMEERTYCRGKPVSDNSVRVLPSDLFTCTQRVDKFARTFTRFRRLKTATTNIKPYCFDKYLEELVLKREYQPHVEELQRCTSQSQDARRRTNGTSTRMRNRMLEERQAHLSGIIEKIYHRYHDQALMPREARCSLDQLAQRPSALVTTNGHRRGHSPTKPKTPVKSSLPSTPARVGKKRRTISLSSDDDIVELLAESESQTPARKRLARSSASSPRKRDPK